MGGYGSGAVGWKPVAEDLKQIDVRKLKRSGVLSFGTEARICFPDGLTVSIVAEPASLLLTFGQVSQRVMLTYMPLHFGGFRVFCLCPECMEQCAILYLYDDRFCCKNCCNVTWSSRNEEPHELKIRKARKIRDRLGASPSLFKPVYGKPLGMHWRTYRKLMEELDELDKGVISPEMIKLMEEYQGSDL